MRGLVILLAIIVLGIAALWWFVPGARSGDMIDFLAALSGEPRVESVAKDPMVPFVAEKGHFKISFPGKPLQLTEKNVWLHQTVLSLPCYMVADKSVSFYAAERKLDDFDRPNNVNLVPLAAGDFSLTGRPKPLGNNEMVRQTASTSDALAIQRYLDQKCEAMVGNAHGKISTKYAVDLGGGMYPGRMAEGTIASTGNKFRMAIYYDAQNKKLFSVAVVGTPERVSSPQATQFLKSMYIWP